KPRIGYVGVGLMGLPMTKRLCALGYAVRVFDVVPKQLDLARDIGAAVANSPADAVQGADLVLLNLPTPAAVETAVFGTDGVASALQPPQLLVDFSTIKVEQGQAYAQRLRERTQCAWIDAPVSGGPPASGTGTLTVMAGGDTSDIERIRSLMADVSARFTHMGPVGSGLAAKMLNQLIVGCIHVVMAEAASMAEAAGIDAARLPECLAGGHADGTLLQRLYPRMVAREFAPQGYARQLRKDLEMVNDYAAALGTPVPMMGQALALYRRLIEAGHSELDTSAVFKLYEQRSI
ncbi:MAG TPA: NAD(P)-dependent oxidoreductase, partial [Burkholderiaceae bacterium]|nr:NAD(P)-dependent oxidoreductase [Burkholderiaceae bacterium]